MRNVLNIVAGGIALGFILYLVVVLVTLLDRVVPASRLGLLILGCTILAALYDVSSVSNE